MATVLAGEKHPGLPPGWKRLLAGAARGALTFAIGAVPVACLWAAIDTPVETDAYFHLAIARDYASRPFVYETRIREGLLARRKADREILFHFQLAGLLRLGLAPLTAAAVVTAAASGVTALVLYGYSGSLLVAVCGIFASQTFLYRLHMCRPQSWAIALFVLGLALLLKGRYRWAAFVNFAYTLSYSVPVLLVGAAVVRAIARREMRALAWVGGGSVLGLLLHPHFPDNLVILWYQGFVVVRNALFGNTLGISVPDELEPRPLWDFAQEFYLVMILLGASTLLRAGPAWLVGLQVLFLVLSLRLRRLIEYWVPMVALTSGPLFTWAMPRRPIVLRCALVGILLLVTVVPNLNVALKAARLHVTGTYREAGEWLKANGAESVVFNAHWGSYAELRYFGGNFWLTHGHDPAFVAAYAPERQRRLDGALRGELSAGEIRRELGSRFVVAPQDTPIVKRLTEGDGAAVRFASGGVVVLEI